MNFLKRIAVLLYIILILFFCASFIIFLNHWINFDDIFYFVFVFYFDPRLRVTLSLFIGLLLILNFIVFKLFCSQDDRDRPIAFDNPSGRVKVSGMALEDLIRRKIITLAEVKDVKLRLMKTRKELKVKIRLQLRSEGNIPEITANVQELVKKKLQDIIQLDEPVNVAIFISKIIPETIKPSAVKNKPKEEEKDPPIPFQGYRA